jgi:DNA-directed RNA polymerase specialized sigma24 family protein
MGTTTFEKSAHVELAERMARQYAPGLIGVDWLCEQLAYATGTTTGEDVSGKSLELLARSLCSRALCEACLSQEKHIREQGFEYLRHYLAGKLPTKGGSCGTEDVQADVLQQTMIEIFKSLQKRGGPEDPTAFLKWARVILFRQLSLCKQRARDESGSSLEEQADLLTLVDKANTDPLDAVLHSEKMLELRRVVAAIRNPQYRAVLVHIFFLGLEERELAALWHVRVCDISLWRCRALKALRKQPDLRQKFW